MYKFQGGEGGWRRERESEDEKGGEWRDRGERGKQDRRKSIRTLQYHN